LPLFSLGGRVIGQLTGGPSRCGGSELWDFYGRLNRSWEGGGTDDTRLRPWLDPGDTGVEVVDALSRWTPALLVVGNSNALTATDRTIRHAMQNHGWGANLRSSLDARAALAPGHAIVVLAPSASASAIGSRFRNITVPVLSMKPTLYDDMRMTGTSAGTHFGTTSSQSRVVIRNSSTSMAGGLSGTVTVVDAPSTFGWGAPSSNAVRTASLPGSTSRFAVFGYRRGSSMVGLTAPARRVGFFLQDRPAPISSNGFTLLSAALGWAVQ